MSANTSIPTTSPNFGIRFFSGDGITLLVVATLIMIGLGYLFSRDRCGVLRNWGRPGIAPNGELVALDEVATHDIEFDPPQQPPPAHLP